MERIFKLEECNDEKAIKLSFLRWKSIPPCGMRTLSEIGNLNAERGGIQWSKTKIKKDDQLKPQIEIRLWRLRISKAQQRNFVKLHSLQVIKWGCTNRMSATFKTSIQVKKWPGQ